ncbi:MAG: transporter substrate-binding domain-containing protein [Myxacorys californica WJT36-NPBG1]|jgi:polar amino acid transport system substrate-binding protein|nr:transporter substrate-binding domain-containing protein [Myxacorys californica WJT36-NPBG1]
MRKTVARVFGFMILGGQWFVPPSLLAADFKTIVARDRLIVAVKDNLPPLGFSQQGRLQGFEIDIANRLAQDLLGRSDALELKPVSNRDRIAAVIDGRVDLAIARVTNTTTRSRIVSFSAPYYLDGTGLITRSMSIQNETDLTNQTIAVLNGSSTIATLRYKLPQLKLVGVESYEAAQQLLDAGKADAFAADVSVLTGWARERSGYRVLPLRLSTEALCVVLPKGVQYTELQQRVNSAIARWKTEGWLQQRASYWGLPWATLR